MVEKLEIFVFWNKLDNKKTVLDLSVNSKLLPRTFLCNVGFKNNTEKYCHVMTTSLPGPQAFTMAVPCDRDLECSRQFEPDHSSGVPNP